MVAEALGGLPEDLGEAYEGEGGEGEDQKGRGVEGLEDDDGRRERGRDPVDDFAEQQTLLGRMSTAGIL